MENLNISINSIASILQTAWNILLCGISIYIAIRSSLIKEVTKYIAIAEEETNLTGKEKMALVVSWIKDLIPRLFRVLFTDKVIELMAQNIYDDMKKYRESFIKNNESKKEES